MAAINTAGDLRKFLCNSINSVANGTMDISKARVDGVRAGGVDHDADGVLLPSLDLDAEHVGEVEELLLLLPDVARSVQVHYGHPH